jgi:hypothetical protein
MLKRIVRARWHDGSPRGNVAKIASLDLHSIAREHPKRHTDLFGELFVSGNSLPDEFDSLLPRAAATNRDGILKVQLAPTKAFHSIFPASLKHVKVCEDSGIRTSPSFSPSSSISLPTPLRPFRIDSFDARLVD